MSQFKQLMTGKISLRNKIGQVGEIMVYVHTMNKLNTFSLPVRKHLMLLPLGGWRSCSLIAVLGNSTVDRPRSLSSWD
jgi:hypothetical protein